MGLFDFLLTRKAKNLVAYLLSTFTLMQMQGRQAYAQPMPEGFSAETLISFSEVVELGRDWMNNSTDSAKRKKFVQVAIDSVKRFGETAKKSDNVDAVRIAGGMAEIVVKILKGGVNGNNLHELVSLVEEAGEKGYIKKTDLDKFRGNVSKALRTEVSDKELFAIRVRQVVDNAGSQLLTIAPANLQLGLSGFKIGGKEYNFKITKDGLVLSTAGRPSVIILTMDQLVQVRSSVENTKNINLALTVIKSRLWNYVQATLEREHLI